MLVRRTHTPDKHRNQLIVLIRLTRVLNKHRNTPPMLV